MKNSPFSFRWLSLAVILPLLVLAVLAWLGTRAQIRGAWANAREEAETKAISIAAEVAQSLNESKKETLPSFPNPPVPGLPVSADDPLNGEDLIGLKKLRDDREAGLSPAGLPRRALASLRVAEITREKIDAEIAVKIASEKAPSVLTPKIFERINTLFPKLAEEHENRWQQSVAAQDAAAKFSNLDSEGAFIFPDQNHILWIGRENENLYFIEGYDPGSTAQTPQLPKWAGIRFLLNGESWPTSFDRPAEAPDFEILSSKPVPFGKNLRVEIFAKHPELITAAARRQAQWAVAIMVVAIAVSATGLLLMRRVLERERKLNALKSDFVASVSHELRAPIASIRLMADALEAGKIDAPTGHEFHRLISRESVRLSTLIENVLDFARIEQGRKRWIFEETDLRDLLLDTVSLMEPLAAEKQIKLVRQEIAKIATANVDPDAIRQALVNLLDNAIKFSPIGSAIQIRLLPDEPVSHRIEISDLGPGIPLTEQTKIFEKFYRLGSELRRESQGTGIGLSLVKAVAKIHGGHIEIQSEIGKGSTFILTLP